MNINLLAHTVFATNLQAKITDKQSDTYKAEIEQELAKYDIFRSRS